MRMIAAILLTGLLLHGGLLAQEMPREKLAAENVELYAERKDEVVYLTSLVQLCCRETDVLFGAVLRPRKALAFTLVDGAVPSGRHSWQLITLSNAESIQQTLWRIFRGTLYRRLQEERKEGGRRGEAGFIPALAAAMTNRVIYCGLADGGSYRPDFRIPRTQFQRRRFPSLRALLEEPAPQGNETLFRLYMVHANLLLDILENAVADLPSLLVEWCQAEADGLAWDEALRKALPLGSIRLGEPLQDWYERKALAIASRSLRGDSPEEVRETLEGLMTVSVLSADSREGIVRIPLERIPAKLKDYRLDDSALSNIQNRLMNLQRRAPALLREAIGKYAKAVNEFQMRDFRTFQETLAEARREFAAAEGRQKRAEEMLREAEAGEINRRCLQDWDAILERRRTIPVERLFPEVAP